MSHDLAGRFFTAEPRGKPHILVYRCKVYSKWKQNMNESMKRVDCNSHILHHFTQLYDILSFDTEIIILLFQHLYNLNLGIPLQSSG